jgi:hypothetical protein
MPSHFTRRGNACPNKVSGRADRTGDHGRSQENRQLFKAYGVRTLKRAFRSFAQHEAAQVASLQKERR